jgi:LDH2 family malate/lactate/ureidoglycolate dehydrogenase
MDNWIKGFRNARPIKGEEKILVPGDPEREFEEERMKNGIPLLDMVVEDLNKLGERFSVALVH